MPRYFFNIRDDAGVTQDREGEEFCDRDAAMHEAELAAREVAADAIRRGLPVPNRHIEVMDKDGKLAGTCDMRSVIER